VLVGTHRSAWSYFLIVSYVNPLRVQLLLQPVHGDDETRARTRIGSSHIRGFISPRCHSIARYFWTRGCCYPFRFPSTSHPNFKSPNPVRHSTNAPFTAFSNPKLTLPWPAIQQQLPVFEPYFSTTTLEASMSICSCYAKLAKSRDPTYIVPLFHPPALQEMGLRRLAVILSHTEPQPLSQAIDRPACTYPQSRQCGHPSCTLALL
jgi:hypothetical protein